VTKYPRNEVIGILGGTQYRAEAVAPDQTITLYRKGGPQPADPRFVYDQKWDLWEVTLPISECEGVFELSSFARYRGIPCRVMSIDDAGRALLYYVGHSGHEAEKNGFEQTDPGTYSNIVPVNELYDYHEEHRDLLFDHWRRATFPQPVEERA
jgi:hypothetical protein